MYFNTVLTDSAKLLKPLLVFSFVMLAILAGLTRIIQFRNHPVDVYCGWLLGAAIAIYLVTESTSHKHFPKVSCVASSLFCVYSYKYNTSCVEITKKMEELHLQNRAVMNIWQRPCSLNRTDKSNVMLRRQRIIQL